MEALGKLMRYINAANEFLGRTVAWFAITMVLVQFAVVVLRYVFGIGSIMMQESVIYMHAIIFMIGAGYTLMHNGHVRVDVFYREATPRKKAWVDMGGVLFMLVPVCALIFWSSWGYVMNSWAIFEGSKETSGIQAVFLLKTIILVFAFLMILQGISMVARSILVLSGVEIPEEKEVHEAV